MSIYADAFSASLGGPAPAVDDVLASAPAAQAVPTQRRQWPDLEVTHDHVILATISTGATVRTGMQRPDTTLAAWLRAWGLHVELVLTACLGERWPPWPRRRRSRWHPSACGWSQPSTGDEPRPPPSRRAVGRAVGGHAAGSPALGRRRLGRDLLGRPEPRARHRGRHCRRHCGVPWAALDLAGPHPRGRRRRPCQRRLVGEPPAAHLAGPGRRRWWRRRACRRRTPPPWCSGSPPTQTSQTSAGRHRPRGGPRPGRSRTLGLRLGLP